MLLCFLDVHSTISSSMDRSIVGVLSGCESICPGGGGNEGGEGYIQLVIGGDGDVGVRGGWRGWGG